MKVTSIPYCLLYMSVNELNEIDVGYSVEIVENVKERYITKSLNVKCIDVTNS